VRLGPVRRFDDDEGTFYVAVRETAALDRARRRLYDRSHVALPGRPTWTWHVTCVRDSRGRDLDALRRAAEALDVDLPWRIERMGRLELRGDRYEPLATWRVGRAGARPGPRPSGAG